MIGILLYPVLYSWFPLPDECREWMQRSICSVQIKHLRTLLTTIMLCSWFYARTYCEQKMWFREPWVCACSIYLRHSIVVFLRKINVMIKKWTRTLVMNFAVFPFGVKLSVSLFSYCTIALNLLSINSLKARLIFEINPSWFYIGYPIDIEDCAQTASNIKTVCMRQYISLMI